MPGIRPRNTTQRRIVDGGSSSSVGANDDSVEGGELDKVGRVSEDSAEGEDAGGCGGELGWKGCWDKCISSAAWSSAANSVFIEKSENAESKLDEDEADERRFSPGSSWSWVCPEGCE